MLDGLSHVENDLPRNLSVAHFEDMNEPHLHLAAEREMPVAVFRDLKADGNLSPPPPYP